MAENGESKKIYKRYILPSDIENFVKNGNIKILGADSSYTYISLLYRDLVIFYGTKIVWCLDKDGKPRELYPGWQDAAKKKIAKHSNKGLPLSAMIKRYAMLVWSWIKRNLVSIIEKLLGKLN